MGLTSGRGGRGGARGSGRDGYAGRENGGQRGRTSLVSRDGYGQQGDNRLRGEYATRYANGQHDYYASYASPGQGDGSGRWELRAWRIWP